MRETAMRVRENRMRRIAHRMGWQLCRSRARILHTHDRGLWQLVDDKNRVVAGADFDATLDVIEAALAAEQKRLAGG